MQVRRGILDATQGERFDRPIGTGHESVDLPWFVEALRLQIVHKIIGVVGRLMATHTVRSAKKKSLPTHLGLIAFSGIDLAVDAQLGRWREVRYLLEHLAATLKNVNALFGSNHRVAVASG